MKLNVPSSQAIIKKSLCINYIIPCMHQTDKNTHSSDIILRSMKGMREFPIKMQSAQGTSIAPQGCLNFLY